MPPGTHLSLGEGMPVWIVGSDVAGGGGGGAATIADGADVTQGAKADAAWDGSAGSPTAQAILKATYAKIEAMRALIAGGPQPIAMIFKSKTDASITAGTAVGLWTPGAGKKFRIYGYSLQATTSAQIIFKSGATELFRTAKPTGASLMAQSFFPGYIQGLANDDVLSLDVSATSNVGGYVYGIEV